MSRIVVTGGSGFIGSHLVDCLAEKGHEVTIVDITEPRWGVERAVWKKVDILDLNGLTRVFQEQEFIYHLAAEANVDVIHRMPVTSSAVNVQGTINVLEAARHNKCRRVLFASTEWVYGAAEADVVDETTKLYPPAPNHLYTGHKIAGEFALQAYQRQYSLDYTIMRFGIPFGPRARKETVTCKFLLEALRGGTITLNAGGRQFRQFIYVKDLADGCVACLKDEARNEIINLNGAERVTILRIAETIKNHINLPFRVQVNDEGRMGDFEGRMVNTDKAWRLIGWKPRHSYDEAMRSYVDWFRVHAIDNVTSGGGL